MLCMIGLSHIYSAGGLSSDGKGELYHCGWYKQIEQVAFVDLQFDF